MSLTAVVVRGITKSYRSGRTITPVLTGVDLDVREGECLFLVGPSGSGKSTLLSILGCVLSSDTGRMELLGECVTQLDEHHRSRFRRRNIGFVFQRYQLFRGLSALDNVALRLKMLGFRGRAARTEARRLIDTVGLGEKTGFRIDQLSMGQRQRIALARALAGSPKLLLADEPTAALDAEAGQTAMRLLHDLAKVENTTVIVVTHDNRIFSMADRILHLENGQITKETAAVGDAIHSAID